MSTLIGMVRKTLVLLFYFTSLGSLLAQATGSLSGVVIDSKTKVPIPFASVFLANTALGASANQDGIYQIKSIPVGKYDLTVSSLGYLVRQIAISTTLEAKEVNIDLIPDVRYLKEVTFKVKKLNREKWMRIFKEYFVGRTDVSPNVRECRIVNQDKIEFDYDEDTQLFTVFCSEPIHVENDALGYQFYFLLQEFIVDYDKKRYLIGGIPRFEEMIAKSEAQKRKWTKERDRVYNGSINHFMRSLMQHRLARESFSIYTLCGGEQSAVNMDSIFGKNNRSQLIARCPIQIIYRGEPRAQISEIKLLDGVITVHENGYYEDQLRVDLEGYYGQHEKIASESIPLEYQPLKKK